MNLMVKKLMDILLIYAMTVDLEAKWMIAVYVENGVEAPNILLIYVVTVDLEVKRKIAVNAGLGVLNFEH